MMSIFSIVGIPQLDRAAETLAARIGRVSDGAVLANDRLGGRGSIKARLRDIDCPHHANGKRLFSALAFFISCFRLSPVFHCCNFCL